MNKDEYHNKWYLKHKIKRRKQIYARRLAIRQWLDEIKRKVICVVCGFSGQVNPSALDFHHKNPRVKFKTISKMATDGYSKARILTEITKCVPMCANCHRATF